MEMSNPQTALEIRPVLNTGIACPALKAILTGPGPTDPQPKSSIRRLLLPGLSARASRQIPKL